MDSFISVVALVFTFGIFWYCTPDHECKYQPEPSEADNRLCAPATYPGDCFKRLGYKYVCAEVAK